MNSTLVASSRKLQVPNSLGECLVERWLGAKVEVVDGPWGGEVREPHPGVETPLLGGVNLDTQQLFDELGVTRLGRAGRLELGGERFGCRTQFQIRQVAPELLTDRIFAHDAPLLRSTNR